jgi:hypothetical protein
MATDLSTPLLLRVLQRTLQLLLLRLPTPGGTALRAMYTS